MKISDKLFDILSWVGKVVLPALSVLVITLFKIWMPTSELGTMIGATIMAIDVFLNSMLGIASVNYYKEQNETQI